LNGDSPGSEPVSRLDAVLDAVLELLPRPLDRIRSMKLKLSIVLLGSGGVGIAYLWYRFRWLPSPGIIFVTVAMVLLTAQILAHGMTRPLREMTAAAAAMAQGDYTRRVRATARDEVGQLAGAFNRMAADLAEADQRRRELIANVSHELRTPIAAMQAMLENAVDGITASPDGAGAPEGAGPPEGARAPDVAGAALVQTERLARLVSDFLDLSRRDAGAQSLHRSSVPVRALLDEATTELGLLAVAGVPGPRFVVDVEPADLEVFADRVRLRQVVGNLLDNAARHGPADGEVTATAWAQGDRVVIEVRDEGPGIPIDDRHQMFERFTRGERAGGGGTGLGLAIARWVVDLHGGRIAVVDHPGVGGCAIRVTLPAEPGAPDSTVEAS
jgi:signal transduction histidine kinase